MRQSGMGLARMVRSSFGDSASPPRAHNTTPNITNHHDVEEENQDACASIRLGRGTWCGEGVKRIKASCLDETRQKIGWSWLCNDEVRAHVLAAVCVWVQDGLTHLAREMLGSCSLTTYFAIVEFPQVMAFFFHSTACHACDICDWQRSHGDNRRIAEAGEHIVFDLFQFMFGEGVRTHVHQVLRGHPEVMCLQGARYIYIYRCCFTQNGVNSRKSVSSSYIYIQIRISDNPNVKWIRHLHSTHRFRDSGWDLNEARGSVSASRLAAARP